MNFWPFNFLTAKELAAQLKPMFAAIQNLKELVMATQAELAQQLRDLKAQADKAKAEIVAKVAALEEAIANAGSTTPDVDEAMAALKVSVQGVDDLNQDAG